MNWSYFMLGLFVGFLLGIIAISVTLAITDIISNNKEIHKRFLEFDKEELENCKKLIKNYEKIIANDEKIIANYKKQLK